MFQQLVILYMEMLLLAHYFWMIQAKENVEQHHQLQIQLHVIQLLVR